MRTVNIHEAKTHLSKILAEVEKGEEYVVARAGKAIALLSPIRRPHTQPRPGKWKGRVVIRKDFDAEDERINALFEGRAPVKYLVDTHVFLWWMTNPDALSSKVADLIKSGSGDIAFSSVSGWEIAVKSSLGKIKGVPIGDIPAELEALGWRELSLALRHLPAIAALPFHHHDPFDRALIGQAISESLIFVTCDESASEYPVKIFW